MNAKTIVSHIMFFSVSFSGTGAIALDLENFKYGGVGCAGGSTQIKQIDDSTFEVSFSGLAIRDQEINKLSRKWCQLDLSINAAPEGKTIVLKEIEINGNRSDVSEDGGYIKADFDVLGSVESRRIIESNAGFGEFTIRKPLDISVCAGPEPMRFLSSFALENYEKRLHPIHDFVYLYGIKYPTLNYSNTVNLHSVKTMALRSVKFFFETIDCKTAPIANQ